MSTKTFRPVTDTFYRVIRWNRKTGASDITEFFGADPSEKEKAEVFAAGASQDIIAGRGPYDQVTLEVRTCTTWEYR
jgi:hypothetical protein